MSLASRAVLRQRLLQQAPQWGSRNLATLLVNRTAREALRAPTLLGKTHNAFQRRLQSTLEVPQHEQEADPPRRSRTGRFLWSVVKYTVGGLLCFFFGYLAGGLTHPSRRIWVAALSTRSPSDEETLAMYAPPDPATAAINAHILTHPVAEALRHTPGWHESRPHLKIPEELRNVNLTGGALAGPGRIVVPPLQFVEEAGKGYVAIFYLGRELCGHPGIVHGGMLATLLDEGLARCCFRALPNGVGVTANLKVDYRRPVMAEGYYVLRARTDRVEGRKAWVTGWIERLGEGDEVGTAGVQGIEAKAAEDKKPVDGKEKLVEATALFIEPRNAKLMASLYKSRA